MPTFAVEITSREALETELDRVVDEAILVPVLQHSSGRPLSGSSSSLSAPPTWSSSCSVGLPCAA